jgi:hypothetical protein
MKTHANPWRDVVALLVGTAALVGASLVLPSPAHAASPAPAPQRTA